MFSYTKNQWLSISLKRKLGAFSMVVILVMGLPITFNMLIMNFSLESLNVMFNNDSLRHDVQGSMEQEAGVFELHVREQSWENAKQYRLACSKTESSLGALPFDYDAIEPERYARTWNIKNSYEGRQTFRDRVLHMNQSDEESVEQLYRVYGIQGYLQTYARRLMQSTLKEGKRSYRGKVPLFYGLPYMIMTCSVPMIITVICLTRLLPSTLVAPMVELVHSPKEVARNDFGDENLVVENRDEMEELVQAFNKMKHAVREYINILKEKDEMAERLHKERVERIETEKRLDAAHLELLKGQVNPRFLLNTLNMIPCMAKLEEAQTTKQMIFSLGNLFRYNLKTSERIILLERELRAMQDYTYIQQICFGSRISHDLRAEMDGSETMVPAFTPQPPTENAIIHGIIKKGEGRRIFLGMWKRKNKIVISLTDTGAGTEEEVFKRPVDVLKGHRTAKTGIGLGDIYQRIKSMYEDGDLRTYSKVSEGIMVQIILSVAREGDYQKT